MRRLITTAFSSQPAIIEDASSRARGFYLTRKGSRLLGKVATAPKYRLLRPLLADYPCRVEDEKKGVAVEGELWEVSDECPADLAAVEGVPHLFVRKPGTLNSGEEVDAYFIRERPGSPGRGGNGASEDQARAF